MINTTNGLRFNFDYERNKWMVETPIVLNKKQMEIAISNARAQFTVRLRGEFGEKKRRMIEAVALFSASNVEQYIIGHGEKTLYLAPNVKY